MSPQTEKSPKIGTEITVRISLTFQEAPDVHTLLAMTPVRERGKLVRSALERYIANTNHPAGEVEQQIHAISSWLRSRTPRKEAAVSTENAVSADDAYVVVETHQARNVSEHMPERSGPVPELAASPGPSSSSVKRWLQT
jgi:hypothetical protein